MPLQFLLGGGNMHGYACIFKGHIPYGLLVHARAATRRLKRARFAAAVRLIRELDQEGLAELVGQHLPPWVRVSVFVRICVCAHTHG